MKFDRGEGCHTQINMCTFVKNFIFTILKHSAYTSGHSFAKINILNVMLALIIEAHT